MFKKIFPIVLALILGALALAFYATPARAATHSPCLRHSAVAPYVSSVDDGVSTLTFAGDIGGCPSSITTESVSIVVHAQYLENGVWTDKASQAYSRSWNRYSRYARQAGGSFQYAPCVDGDWRTLVTGGDGFEPYEWSSPVITFTSLNDHTCGSWGGGD